VSNLGNPVRNKKRGQAVFEFTILFLLMVIFGVLVFSLGRSEIRGVWEKMKEQIEAPCAGC